MKDLDDAVGSRALGIEEAAASFLEMEEEHDFLDRTVEGVRFWERVRFRVFREVCASQGFPEVSHGKARSGWARWRRRGVNIVRSLTTRNPALGGSADVLFVGHPRRALTPEGRWKDIYCDPLMRAIEASSMLVEGPFNDEHKRPTVTPRAYYVDYITYATWLKRSPPSLTRDEEASLRDVDDALASRFEAPGSVRPFVKHILKANETRAPLWERLLERVKPRVVVVVVSYTQEDVVLAAKRLGIPVVELQHGIVHPYHLGYHFPGDRGKEAFPDYVFTWGPAWNDRAAFPIPSKNVIATGYAHLMDQRDALKGKVKKDRIVFISQPGSGEVLSKLAASLTDRTRFEVCYKVHPSESDDWRERYPWLAKSDVRIKTRGLHKVLASSKVQVGHMSTALFEGLAYGLRTLIVDIPGHQAASSVLEEAGARLVSTVEDIEAALEDADAPSPDVDAWFAPEPRLGFKEALSNVLDRQK